MSNQKKTHELIRQNEQLVKKSQKHDANLQKNSTLYFQIGLIVCLLAAFGLLEMTFETTVSTVSTLPFIDDDLYVYNDNVKIYEEEKVEKKELKKKPPVIFKDPIIREDDSSLDETPEIFTELPDSSNPPIDPSSVNPGEKPVLGLEDVPFILIETAPIYPGCEKAKNNEQRKKCMSKKITKLIQRRFKGNDIASDYGLFGKQKIHVQFKIDKNGDITGIRTRAPHPKLQDEAERVIKIIPKMTPGKQRDKNVGVIYTLPIIFHVE